MKGSNQYFASRGVGYFLMLPVIILSAAAMVLYAKYGVNIYATEYSSKLYLCGGMAIGFAVLSMVVDLLPLSFAKEFVKPVRAVSFLLLLYAIMQYILTQIMFLGALFVAIDVEQYSPLIPGFTATTACLLLGTVLALAGTLLGNRPSKARNAEVKA